jgi:hypothetical protein
MTFSIMTLSIKICNAECRDYLNVILSVVMLNVIMVSVNGVTPGQCQKYDTYFEYPFLFSVLFLRPRSD